MAIPAWSVVGWPEVFATVEELEEALSRLQPLGTSLQHNPAERPSRQGQALWGGSIKGCKVGIAWEWAEVTNSVVALSDPMRVISNLILTDSEGRMLDDSSCMLELNGVIHGLPWQELVLASSRPGQEHRAMM